MSFKKYIFCLLLVFPLLANGQVAKDSEVFLQLKSRDSLLFDRGFNRCEISAFENFVSEDLEFYHDQGGLSTTKDEFLKAVKQNICGNPEKKPIRKLRSQTLEVFPLFNNGQLYGAIQKGVHDFFIKEPGKDLYQTSTAKFTHIWLLQDDRWILKRVLSYDHQSPH